MPVTYTDNITIHHGGASFLFGTAALGGVINLENKFLFEKKFAARFQAETGSISGIKVIPSIEWGNQKFFSGTRILFERNENNYSFTNTTLAGSPEQKQQHAAVRNYGWMQTLGLKLTESLTLKSGIWHQSLHREIPPLMVVPESKEEQRDSIFRVFISAKKLFLKSSLEIKAAYFDEHQLYTNEAIPFSAIYNNRSIKSEVEYVQTFSNRLSANAVVSFSHYEPEIKEYAGTIRKKYFSVQTAVRYMLYNSTVVTAGIRHDRSDDITSPLSPAAGIEAEIIPQKLVLKATAGKHFNLPSMNDLYWKPGGNTHLLPESAWSFSGGYALKCRRKNKLESEQTIYSMLVNDWIQWQPSASGYHEAINIRQVHSRGIENSLMYKIPWQKNIFILKGKYNFTLSTNEEAGGLNGDELKGKQLIYVPEHSAYGEIIFKRKNLLIGFSWQHTGIRFTTDDNSYFLPGFNIAKAYLRWTMILKEFTIEPYFSINNLFNESYQLIAFRPEPGLHFQAGTRINFIKYNN